MPSSSFPTGPRGLAALRHLLAIGHERKGLDEYRALKERYGDRVGLKVGPASVITTFLPEDARIVFKDQRDLFGRGGPLSRAVRPLVGDSLVPMDDPVERNALRGELTRALSAASLACFAPGGAADALVTAMLDRWEARAERADGGQIEVTSDLSSLAFAIAGEAILGLDVTAHEDAIIADSHAYWKRTMARAALPLALPEWIPTPGARRSRRFIRGVHGALDEILARILNREASGSPMAELAAATEQDDAGRKRLREQLLTLVLASHETVYSMLAFTLHLLSHHPEVQDEVREQDRSIPGRESAPDDEDYVTRVLRESLRLYPPAPVNIRVALEDTELAGHAVPRDTIVFYPLWLAHRDSRFWDDPLTFAPDRFTKPAQKEIPDFAYFPFAKGGARACVGERFALHEGALVVDRIVKRFQFAPTGPIAIPTKLVLNMVPAEPLRLRITPRTGACLRAE